MRKIVEQLHNNKAYQALLEGTNDVVINHINEEALLIASAFLSYPKDTVIIKENQYQANLLYQQLATLLGNDVLYFPVDESYRVEALAASPELLTERIDTMYQLTNNKAHLLICHVHSLIRYVPTKEVFLQHILEYKIGDTIDIFDMQRKLHQLGYRHENKVLEQFTYSKRGGVIDIYTISSSYPVRIEFFDDEIESMRYFDTTNQRTFETVNQITIIPASDILYLEEQKDIVCGKIHGLSVEQEVDDQHVDEFEQMIALDKENIHNHVNDITIYPYFGLFKQTTSILSYLNQPKVILSNPHAIEQSYKHYMTENFYYLSQLEQIGKVLKGLPLYLDYYPLLPDDVTHIEQYHSNDNQVLFLSHNLEVMDTPKSIIENVKKYLVDNKILFSMENQHQIRLLIELLEEHQLPFTLISLKDQIFDGINIYIGTMHQGIELLEEKIVVITAKEIFPKSNIHQPKYIKYKEAKVIKDYQELHLDDYVVHDHHGIGQFLGIKTMEVQGCKKDYLYLGYANNDTLYIPVEQFKLIRKYSTSDAKTPKLHQLGGVEWAKTKRRVKAKLDDITDTLIDIYASRMQQIGFACQSDFAIQKEFEDAFNYPLTPDQERSVMEIKADMEKTQPMDRLLCGDVGFGKTEVALRAVFKAIVNDKQVAFLCPTTILSMQHYKTMIQRFDGFPVSIALMNRFTSSKQKKEIIEGLKNGTIDILVGTHSILSKDIVFKDLGFLAIDEEQRFGVSQKEKIKEFRKTIDVLSLSATPIPRTLQMSLMNIRGLSQIDTPPKDRMPVQTYVVEKNQTLIKQVIERELARQGQVFYLYNHTSEIQNVAYRLSLELPNARIAIGHGKMHKDELENVMLQFTNREYDILVCTTIIETGIDIPNANTIIVDQANHFGLSQLYQIKGRVGRSNRSAYAYLLYDGHKQMTEEATKRLKAIKEFTQLGSGYKIAMRDLSIRGAGDLLGGQQAGFIDSVGFDIFMRILQETLDEKRQTKELKEKEIVPVAINVEGYIPSDYVSSDIEKLEIYQRLEQTKSLQQVMELEDEFDDYYGHLPEQLLTLLQKRKLDILSNNEAFEKIQEMKGEIEILFTKEFTSKVDGMDLFQKVLAQFPSTRFKTMSNTIKITFKKDENWLLKINQLLEELI
ncbi:transcription-repair coupling factor [Tannockella kyphosi]|uniref:transcription-repair coupling factor n=1 Tax=Tannockella kyphosi TaxID=2899121 RepID=UPI002010D21C|nr:transcription-repair coupling factor [Tannockella kyphosi]